MIDIFGVTPEPWQKEGLIALAKEDKVSIRSGHGVGKSAFDSWAIFWYMTCHFPCKVPCTAPTMHQLRDVLWGELGIWHRKMPEQLRSQFNIKHSDQDMRVTLAGAPNESYAVARAGRKDNPEALQGFHSDNLMFVIDEASGVPDIIFEVAQGALSTPGAKVLMTANPTRTSGYFYDSHHKLRDRFHVMKVSCFDSSRVDRQYIDDAKLTYGLESNAYRVRVLGDFPKAEDDVIIPLEMVEGALEREVAYNENVKPVWGLDVARFGNCRTALAKRQGNRLIEPVKSWHKRNLMEVSGLVAAEYEDTPDDLLPGEILIDSCGLGAGVLDRMRELGLPVRGINVGETASGRERFTNLKAELWWRCRDWFDQRDCSMDDDRLAGQLSSVKYKYTSSGKIQIESKEQMMQRGVNSPDEADAFVLTFAGTIRRLENERYSKPRNWRSRRRRSPWTR